MKPIFYGILLCILQNSCSHSPKPPPAGLDKPAQDTVLQFSETTVSRLDSHFTSLYEKHRFNGNILLFNNDSVFSKAYGTRQLNTDDSLRLSDPFQLASVSKTITSYAALILLDRGLLQLDTPLKDVFLEFPYEGVTVGMLLDHTSGLGNYAYVTDSLWGMPDSFMCHDDFECLVMAGKLPIYYPPDKTFNYCNTNYALLASIIERVSGKRYAAFLEDEIFTPLGMKDAFVVDTENLEQEDIKVLGHYPNGKQKRYFYLDPICGDKGIYASVRDMLAFYKEVKSPTLVAREWVEKARSPSEKTGYNNNFYGLGWRIKYLDNQDTIVYHNGWWRGFRTYFWTYKHRDKAAIILTNWSKSGYIRQDEIFALF